MFLKCCLFSSLLLSGNPLDCVCENLWIKLRLLEEADSPDLKCTDNRGLSQAFITLSPPDCGNVMLKQVTLGIRCWILKTEVCEQIARSFLAVIPRVEVNPKMVTEMQGSNVKAVCSASGSPPPEILWNLDMLSTHHEVSRATTHSLLFKPVLLIHFGLLFPTPLVERWSQDMPSNEMAVVEHIHYKLRLCFKASSVKSNPKKVTI